MVICEVNHIQICFDGELCPICDKKEEVEIDKDLSNNKIEEFVVFLNEIQELIRFQDPEIKVTIYEKYLEYLPIEMLQHESNDRGISFNQGLSRKDTIKHLSDWYGNAIMDEPEYVADMVYIGEI